MPNVPVKTDAERVADANEIIRKLLIEKRGLQRQVNDLQVEKDTAEAIREQIWQIAAHNPEPPTWLTPKVGRIGTRGTPITVWSDSHYGEVVDPDTVAGVNKFNAIISRNRLFRLLRYNS